MSGIFDDERGDTEPIRSNPAGTRPMFPPDCVAKGLKWVTLRRLSRLAGEKMGRANTTS